MIRLRSRGVQGELPPFDRLRAVLSEVEGRRDLAGGTRGSYTRGT